MLSSRAQGLVVGHVQHLDLHIHVRVQVAAQVAVQQLQPAVRQPGLGLARAGGIDGRREARWVSESDVVSGLGALVPMSLASRGGKRVEYLHWPRQVSSEVVPPARW